MTLKTGQDISNRVALLGVIEHHWGHGDFRPLQEAAMMRVLGDRDSLVVLPTGGGKSLCFQAPALVREGTAVVVSPLISLMKDQVDGLRRRGVPSAYLNSSQDQGEQEGVILDLLRGELRLLYITPERLLTPIMAHRLREVSVTFLAVDEAHCISEWGHDFRPEYSLIHRIREIFPGMSIHAYTATASPRVREDILARLGLRDPAVLVGSFDRPNLSYHCIRRVDRAGQILDRVRVHRGQPGIVYAISRKDAEAITGELVADGHRAVTYHAGLGLEERRRNQERFLEGDCEVVVATTAFGMGIDKPDVRYVLHAGLPRSLEAYQQEIGRAGRDGEPARCEMLFNGTDVRRWLRILGDREGRRTLARAEGRTPLAMPWLPDAANVSRAEPPDEHDRLRRVLEFASGTTCRRRVLLAHFGETLPAGRCRGCDVCRDENGPVENPLTIGQKILSCVLRVEESWGADHVARVLIGATHRKIRERGHDRLSTFGLLRDHDRKGVRDFIEQLIEQGFLRRVEDYGILTLTPRGGCLLRGEQTPRLIRPRIVPARKRSRPSPPPVDPEIHALFEHLRELRSQEARTRGVPAYHVFPDRTLEAMARQRPRRLEDMRAIPGVGELKLERFGPRFLERIQAFELPSHSEVSSPRVARADRAALRAAPSRSTLGGP